MASKREVSSKYYNAETLTLFKDEISRLILAAAVRSI
jgi:hypothetical protein